MFSDIKEFFSYDTFSRAKTICSFNASACSLSAWCVVKFSILDNQKEVIQKLNDSQGKYIKVKYEERYTSFAWWGDTNYFITEVTNEKSPHFGK